MEQKKPLSLRLSIWLTLGWVIVAAVWIVLSLVLLESRPYMVGEIRTEPSQLLVFFLPLLSFLLYFSSTIIAPLYIIAFLVSIVALYLAYRSNYSIRVPLILIFLHLAIIVLSFLLFFRV